MKSVTFTAKTSVEEILAQVQQEDLVFMRDGHPVALLIPFDDDDLEWYARERDPAFLASVAQARQQIKKGETVSHQDLKKDLGLN